MTAGPFACQSIVHLDGFFFTVFVLLVQPFEHGNGLFPTKEVLKDFKFGY